MASRNKTWWINPKTLELEDYYPQSAPELHFVQDDTIPQTMDPVTGRLVESKSALRRIYHEKGYTEVGNEYVNKPYKPVEHFNTGRTEEILSELTFGKIRD